jgi:hypothetical protein
MFSYSLILYPNVEQKSSPQPTCCSDIAARQSSIARGLDPNLQLYWVEGKLNLPAKGLVQRAGPHGNKAARAGKSLLGLDARRFDLRQPTSQHDVHGPTRK